MIKALLKRFPPAAWANARIKCARMQQQYRRLCRHYGTASVIDTPQSVATLTKELWSRRPVATDVPRYRVLFVGTDLYQDSSGTIQGLQSCAEVTVFEHRPGKHGQYWPSRKADFERARLWNGDVLRRYVRKFRFDMIIGQMWGLSMDWRALAEARDRGIEVVNIAMDDRHSFGGRQFADGSDSGTRGIAAQVSLACTDAAETVAWYESEGCRAMFLPEASDGEIFRPSLGAKEVDVSFVGARYGIRERLVNALRRAGVDVVPFGDGWPNGRIVSAEVPALFARSQIVLGCGTVGHCDRFVALKLRDFDAVMSGSMYITHANPDLDPLLTPGRELVTFEQVDDLVDKVRFYLDHEREREAIASAGRMRCLAEHTWRDRFRVLLHSVT